MRVVVAEQSPQKQSKPATATLFRCIRFVYLFGSIYPFKGKNRRVDMKKVWYLMLLLLLYVSYLCSLGYSACTRATEGRDSILLASFGTLYFSFMILSLTCTICLPEKIQKLENWFEACEERLDLQRCICKHTRYLKVSVCFMVIAVVVVIITVVVYGVTYDSVFNLCSGFACCAYGQPWKRLILVLDIAITLNTMIAVFSNFIILVALARFTKEQFKMIASDFKDLGNDVETKFQHLADRHEMMVELLARVNDCTSYYMFTGIVPVMPISLTVLYGALSPDRGFSEKMLLISILPGCVAFVGSSLWLLAQVNIWAHKPLKYLWTVQSNATSLQTQHKISVFIARLTTETIGCNIFGLMEIKMPTLLTFFGTLVTYVIVVVQFQHPSNARMFKELLKNCTCAMDQFQT